VSLAANEVSASGQEIRKQMRSLLWRVQYRPNPKPVRQLNQRESKTAPQTQLPNVGIGVALSLNARLFLRQPHMTQCKAMTVA
jgi:hypothetical protein